MKTLTFLIGFFISTSALAENYTVDSRHTFPSFSINHMGFSTQKGRFNTTTGQISLLPEKQTGQIDITIDSNSIDTGLVELEDHLKTADFLDVSRYPNLYFTSTRLQFSKESLTGVDGNLTLHGVTKPVHLNVTHFKCGLNPVAMKQVCGADVSTSFKRSDFGIGKYVPVIADLVNVEIQIEAFKN